MKILFDYVKGRGKNPHVWDLLTPAKMYTVCPTLRRQEWQRQNNELLESKTPETVKLPQIHSVSTGARILKNSKNKLSYKRDLLEILKFHHLFSEI